ncbi:YidC/Oxa1 family membrane protein insertase [uncultured Brachyspira sp.]|uniref:YidC/Oxa1 family membrane protein insertase n=1 Tax=uncultured Brachyspira sp. TaxID=221953 RepID=UPI0026212B9F|nr:YidC/Oxa1 family membrane protein insertase [uncultured Brachyspira sp.]
MFFDVLYNITIYPFQFLIEIIFYFIKFKADILYSLAILYLNIIINIILLPIYNVAEKLQNEEKKIQDKMKPMINNIKAVYKGDQQYLLIRACQKINGYKTIYAFRGTFGLLIQIPIFIAAYNFIDTINPESLDYLFRVIPLYKPDEFLKIGNVTINLLPFLMFTFSMISSFFYNDKLTLKERIPLIAINVFFLVFLYNSNAVFVYYWTLNSLFYLLKNIFIKYKLNFNKSLKKIYINFSIVVYVILIIFIILGKIGHKGYIDDFSIYHKASDKEYFYTLKMKTTSKIFTNTDIYQIDKIVKINSNGINGIVNNGSFLYDKLIENDFYVDAVYTLNVRPRIYLFIIVLTLPFLLFILYKSISIFKLKISDDFNTRKLLILSCISISILIGLFISSSLVHSSPTEFKNPIDMIFDNLFKAIGIFFVYPIFIYFLFDDKIKQLVSFIMYILVPISIVNVFIMAGDYGFINTDFVFNNPDLLLSSLNQSILNIFLIILSIVLVLFLINKLKYNFLSNIYMLISIVLIIVSIYNFNYIKKELDIFNTINTNDISLDNKYLNISRNGTNVFVFLLDAATSSSWNTAFKRNEEFRKAMDGFIFYTNTVSPGANTITGTPALYGGYEYMPYEISTNGTYNITNVQNEALLMIPLLLKEYGYSSVSIAPPYANISGDLSIFNTNENIKAFNSFNIEKELNNYLSSVSDGKKLYSESYKDIFIRFSIFKSLPIIFRHYFYSNGDWFYPFKFFINGTIIPYIELSSVTNNINFNDNGNYYNIMENLTTHNIDYFDSNYMPQLNQSIPNTYDLTVFGDNVSSRVYYANVAAIKLIINFINYLKENNVYDNTKIILVSDHGFFVSHNTEDFYGDIKFINTYNSILLYKDFNSSGELIMSSNFMTVADTPYLTVNHIRNAINPFTKKNITNDFKTNGVYMLELNDLNFNFYEKRYHFNNYYYVKDNIFDTNNWKKFNIDWSSKKVKELNISDNN